MSFSSSSSLQYTLEYCTNLASPWTVVTNVVGSGGMVTLSHTNNANQSFYRLLIQN